MTFFNDLSAYSYQDSEEKLVNIGWLDSHHDFPRSEPSSALIDALLVCASDDKNATRGFHDCEFCDEKSPIRLKTAGGENVVLGMSEIHVLSRGGVKFAAPTLVAHYVAIHSYAPPMDFREAVFDQAHRLSGSK